MRKLRVDIKRKREKIGKGLRKMRKELSKNKERITYGSEGEEDRENVMRLSMGIKVMNKEDREEKREESGKCKGEERGIRKDREKEREDRMGVRFGKVRINGMWKYWREVEMEIERSEGIGTPKKR